MLKYGKIDVSYFVKLLLKHGLARTLRKIKYSVLGLDGNKALGQEGRVLYYHLGTASYFIFRKVVKYSRQCFNLYL